MTVIALTAERGAGKTTLAVAVSARLRARHVSVSRWLSDLIEARGDAATPDALREAGEQAARDPGRLVADVLRHFGWQPGETMIFDAVRHRDVLTALRTEVAPQPVAHVALVLPDAVRAARIAGRGDTAAVAAGGGHSTEAEVRSLLLLADVRLDASLPAEDLAGLLAAAAHRRR